MLDLILKELERRGAETGPYVPPPVERWNATLIQFPTHRWDVERQRAVADQAMNLALAAKRGLRRV
jgi:hypothetical protein